MQINYSEISKFWSANPCAGGCKDFCFDFTRGLRVLEIGCGAGVDAERFVEAGAIYTGIDLTEKAVDLTRKRCPNRHIVQMNAEYLDFPDSYFDLVYSWGVIHHAVNPQKIVDEIHRVLKPQGFFFFMLYHKNSFKYLVEIMFLRKILWFLNHPKYRELRKTCPHPTHEQWVSWNTDNLGCPLSKVYTLDEIEELTKKFNKVSIYAKRQWFLRGWARK